MIRQNIRLPEHSADYKLPSPAPLLPAILWEAAHGRCRPSPCAPQRLAPSHPLRAELERLRQEIGLLREEIRIKGARMQHIEAQKRPHYPPTERLAILELRAARNWSLAQLTQIDSDKDLRRRHRVLMVRVDCALRQVVPVARSHLS